MATGVIGITIIMIILSYIRGNTYEWHNENVIPNGLSGILTSAALSIFTFPCELPSSGGTYKKLIGFGMVGLVGLSIAITAGCLSSITQYRYINTLLFNMEWSNQKIFQLIVTLNHLWLCPFCQYWKVKIFIKSNQLLHAYW